MSSASPVDSHSSSSSLTAMTSLDVTSQVVLAVETLSDFLEDYFSSWKYWETVVFTLFCTFIIWKFMNFFVWHEEPLLKRMKKSFFKTLRRLPYIGPKIRSELEKTRQELEDSLRPKCKLPYVTRLPETGMGKDEIFKRVEQYERMCNVRWLEGRASGAVYGAASLPDLDEVTGKVYAKHIWSNPLHPDLFPNVQKMEAEVIKMTLRLFHGDADSCGNVTSGGTESIMLMVYCYRNWAKSERGIDKPEMIVPHTAHAAFDKAADCFKVSIIHVDEDPLTRRVRVADLRRAITKNTILLVGSAPQFPHGVIDPIQGIAELGAEKGIPVHVDACLGGFLLPFMGSVGFPVEPFDFTVSGVTSISVDTHKYGYAPKGTSLILYREKSWRHHQFFVQTEWPGGIYATPTFAGSRPGAAIAATWAAMMHVGVNGYQDATKRILETRVKLENTVRGIEGLHVEGDPDVCIVAVGSKVFNIFRLSTALGEKGWSLNALQFPSCFHFCLTLLHTEKGVMDDFISDLKDCTAEIMKEPNKKCGGIGAIYGMASTIPDRSIVGELVLAYMDATFAIQEISEEEKENKEATPTKPKSVRAPVITEEHQSESSSYSPTKSASTTTTTTTSASAISTPTKRSRRTTSLDLLYQNIK